MASSSTYTIQPHRHNENLDNYMRDTTGVLYKNQFSRWGGLLSFICGHNHQASGQFSGNRNCVCDSTCVHNKTVIIIMQICKLPTYQTICERISCRKGLVQLHILTSATMTCCFNLSAASFSLLTKKALTFPAPQCFCENGTCVILATILATVGAQKVLFAQLVNTRRSPFEDGPKNSPLIFF